MKEVKRLKRPREDFQEINENENGFTSKRTLILPYDGEKGCSIVRSLDKQLKRLLPNNVKSNFNVRDPIPFTKKHGIIYRSAAMKTTLVNALGLYERGKHSNGRNHLSHL